MKTKLFFMFFVLISTLCTHAQIIQDTSIVTIETKNGGKYSGQIISKSKDSVKINTRDLGVVTISLSEILNQKLVTVETNDGNEFLGEIVHEDDVSITLKTKNFGEVRISKSNLKTMRQIEVQQIKDDKYWFPNPQSTRYFWSPNGYGLEKGEGYYQNIWVLWNQFAYGLTNNFSVGGGIIPTFFFGGAPTPVFATAKLILSFTTGIENFIVAKTGVGAPKRNVGIMPPPSEKLFVIPYANWFHKTQMF